MTPTPDLVSALQLADISEPASIGLWPLAPGWWLVILVCLSLVAALGYWLWRRYQRHRLNQQALYLLTQYWQQQQRQPDSAHFLRQVNQLLKRHCRNLGQHAPLALSGEQWASCIQQHTPAHSHTLINEYNDQLYHAQPSIDLTRLYPDIQQWIRRWRC